MTARNQGCQVTQTDHGQIKDYELQTKVSYDNDATSWSLIKDIGLAD